MATWQAAFLGLLQGATELFPVSSLGHAVVIPTLAHWIFKQSDPSFLPFLVLLHLGTAAALLVLYWSDWVMITRGFVTAGVRGRIREPHERMAMLLVVGTVPAGLVGFVLQKPLRALFASPRTAALFLIVNGILLLGAEVLRRRAERRPGQSKLSDSRGAAEEDAFAEVEALSFRAAALVGLCQALALLPGISRSGVTMAGGLLAGLRHQEAARFSFLLATPIIAAAGVLEVPELLTPGVPLAKYALGAFLAALAAYASARFLIRYFRSGRLDPYGYYCLAAGVLALLLLG
ncbi:MAG: undecaprenyl-diphosphate phosphatase [Candidatus Dormibacteraeota bacterium]|nr:undecaprenyl-diphosphate phosphatase [Candidatus Dormibacteraeota bacterium]